MTGSPVRRTRTALALLTGIALVAGLLLVFDQSLDRRSSAVDARAEVTPAPPLRGQGLGRDRHDLARLRGKVVVVNVWASWCPPCREELPLLIDTAERYDDLELLGLNSNDRPEAARSFLATIGASAMANVSDPDGSHAVEWGARGVPETFVVNRRGKVVARHSGEVTPDWLASAVLPLVQP
jgi:cytochrome c biogenesis protein CcmG/thiol:disulfide interchange protein DsbE